jgi:hypothetical protein
MTEVIALLKDLADRIGRIEEKIGGQLFRKEWYAPAELAELTHKTEHHVRERWCNQQRIKCEKDPDTGRWRIHRTEVERLLGGGGLLPQPKHGFQPIACAV